MLYDDRRVPILWITLVTGLKYDCYSALVTEYDDHHPVLEVDYRYTRDAPLFHPGLCCRAQEYEHYWLLPELMTVEDRGPVAPAVEGRPCASPSMARIDLGNDAFVRRACEDVGPLPRAAPVTGCGSVWILEAASCLS